MSTARWRYASASATGSSHARFDQPCQDASVCRVLTSAGGEPVLVALVADGAGSASRAEAGAQLACTFLCEAIAGELAAGATPASLTRETITGLLSALRCQIAAKAETEGVSSREFASTLLGAVVGLREAVFFQVGDGAIVVSAEDGANGYSWVFWPEIGEYEGTTVFITDAAVEAHLQWTCCEQPCDQVALFSDGLQRLALDFRARTAHAPFFQAKMSAIEAIADPSPDDLSQKLLLFLSSAPVNDRTDDDKTLILATRRRRPAPPERDGNSQPL
jgi:Protein phosphatase 2C